MNKNKYQSYLKIFAYVVITLMCNVYIFAYIFGNGSGKGYCDGDPQPGCPPEKSFNPGYSIEAYVEQGGGYFLNAYSGFLALLNRVEMSNQQGIDYDEMKKLAGQALQNLENAGAVYAVLIELAENTPYNPEVNAKLKAFDFHDFMVKNGLNPIIFNKVAGCLSTGDITGIFKHISEEMAAIHTLLAVIHNDTASNRLPGIRALREANRAFSDTLIFGQQTAQVFDAL